MSNWSDAEIMPLRQREGNRLPYVIYEKKEHIAYITLNRPERLNALGTELSQQLREAETRFAEDDDAWVTVYTGAGDRAFCAGRDLKEAAEKLRDAIHTPAERTQWP